MSGVSYDVLSQFAKLVNKDKKTNVETTVYGTIVEDSNGNKYVKLDGTDQLTPYNTMPAADSTAVAVDVNDRVSVSIKNHTATVTGNMSSPAAKNSEVQEIKQFDILIADRVQAVEAVVGDIEAVHIIVEDLEAAKAKITELEATDATITGKLTAADAEIENLEATKVDASIVDAQYANITGQLKVVNADISNLDAQKASVEDLNASNAKITNLEAANTTITGKLTAAEAEINKLVTDKADVKDLEAQNAEINNLKAKDVEIDKLVAGKADVKDLEAVNATIKSLDTTYANIEFGNITEAAIRKIFSDTGMIKDLVVGDHTVTGELVGVTISGDLIKANTLMAEKLVVRGSDGNYYKLNTDFTTLDGVEPVEEDSIHGSNIIAESITAEKISVKDLVAFGATIGGFEIADNALHSVAKDSVNNTTKGIYMDSDGQVAIGDGTNFIKYFKGTDGKYKLDIAAGSIRLGTSNKSVEEILDNAVDAAANAQNTADTAQAKADAATKDLTNYISATNSALESMQGQIDGSITTWFYEVVPTTSNAPAKDWNTTDLKNIHLGDLYYDTITGYCYRWQVANNVYSWQLVKDTDVTKALEDASAAKDTADKKRQVFTATPTPPYDIGDLWVQGSNGDIMRCQTKKNASQTYVASDWIKASKYTDDTAATNAQNTANNAQNGVNGLTTRVTEAETQIESNKNAIELRATKKEVTETLGDYYTKEQTDAAITVKSNEITQTVSRTYATKPIIVDNGTRLVRISNALANSIENIKLYGKTTQVTTTGKNLLDDSVLRSTTSITEENGVFTGTVGTFYNATKTGALVPDGFLPEQQYVFSLYAKKSDAASTPYLSIEYTDGDAHATKITATDKLTRFTIESKPGKTIKKISIGYGNGGAATLTVKDIQLELGTTVTDYEPYTGGIPSPILENIGDSGSIEVTVAGKNLFDDIAWFESNGFTKQSDGFWLRSQLNKVCFVNTTQKSGSMYLAFTAKTDVTTSPMYFAVYYTDGTVDGSIEVEQSTSFVTKKGITNPNKTVDYIKWTYGGAGTYFIKDVMISFADGDYEPYAAQTLLVATPQGLPGIPVSSGGNYTDANGQQWICDEVDFTRGMLIKRISEVDLGSLTWYYNQSTERFFSSALSSVSKTKPAGISTHLVVTSKDYRNLGDNEMVIFDKAFSSNPICIVRCDGLTDSAAFQAKMHGAMLLHEMEQPIETPLSADEIAAFAELSNEPGTVNVFSESTLEVELSGMASVAAVGDAQETANQAKNAANNATESVAAAESTIKQLADSITQLVRDGNGGSLIKQDSSGLWYFNIGEIEKSISDTATDVAGLQESAGETNAALEILNKTAEDLASQVEYVRSYTDENDQPCLELGEGDSIFKVRITNTDIQFAEGTDVPAKLNRKMLVIEKAMVKQELQFGDDELVDGVWIWQRRSNGNLGLSWKGVSS